MNELKVGDYVQAFSNIPVYYIDEFMATKIGNQPQQPTQ